MQSKTYLRRLRHTFLYEPIAPLAKGSKVTTRHLRDQNVEGIVLTKGGRDITAVDRGDIASRFLRQRQV